MTKLFKSLSDNLSRVNIVFGGGALNSLNNNTDLFDLKVESVIFNIPNIQQDKSNLRNDRNKISKEYSKAVYSKKLELSSK